MKALVSAACLVLAACSHTIDPCPSGSEAYRDEDRCVPISGMRDDASSQVAEGDASMPGEHDADARDASQNDAEQGSWDASPDAGDGGGVPTPEACSAQDIAAWQAFHLQEGVVSTLLGCVAQGCEENSCPASDCVRTAANLEACDLCTDDEAQCVVASCGSACGEPGSDRECRACSCEAGCVARFEQCAQTSLDVCDGVHGRDATADEYAVSTPWLIRAKAATGVWHAGPLTPSPPHTASFPFKLHMSKGFTHVHTFQFAGRAYVLQHKSRCGDDPCLARIWPFLNDGSLGHPVYADTWTRGWNEVETFGVGGQTFLLRYKTGHAPSEGEPADTLRIDRIEAVDGGPGLTLSRMRVQDASSAGPSSYTWTRITSFQLAGANYLLRYGSTRDGELQLLRVDVEDGELTLSAVSSGLRWSRGWDELEVFEHGGAPYVLAYKSGRTPSTEEPPGSARIMGLFAPVQGTLAFTPALYQGVWESGLTRLLFYRHDETTHLLTQNATTGMLRRFELPQEPGQWTQALKSSVWSERWGANPVWDQLDVIRPTLTEVAP